jgi:hypothetical protein
MELILKEAKKKGEAWLIGQLPIYGYAGQVDVVVADATQTGQDLGKWCHDQVLSMSVKSGEC